MVEGTYEIGMQDQAFLGLEAALAMPDSDGHGVELFIATQWLHEDRRRSRSASVLPEERVRLQLAGVGGAFGAREDIEPAGARVPARAAVRASGEDGLRP